MKYLKGRIPSIGGEHINWEGDFNLERIRYVPKEFHENQRKSWVKPFDILMVKDGATTGKVAIVGEDFPFEDCNINEHVFRIEVDERYNPFYVFAYLFSGLGQQQISRLTSGAAQKGITKDAIKQIAIPVPPPETQNAIGDRAKRARDESRQLRVEAKDIIEKAKEQVERMMVEDKMI